MSIRITGVEMHVLYCKSKELHPVRSTVRGGVIAQLLLSNPQAAFTKCIVKILTVVSHLTSTVALQVSKHF